MEKRGPDSKVFVEELKGFREDEVVSSTFLVAQKTRLLTKSNKPYLALKLMDRTGEVEARVWNRADEAGAAFEAADFVRVRAKIDYYREILQLSVQDIVKLLPGEVDPALFTPTPKKDGEALWKELLGFLNTVKDEGLKGLLLSFFEDEEFAALFKNAAAAKMMHHDYPGGLLEHTVAVARLVASACDIYPELDRDLLVTGALLHDVGKVKELLQFPHKDYSTEGRLMGHIILGVEMVGERLARHPEIGEERAMLLKHLIISHHGLPEFGSPVPPMTLEGFVLNLADDLDAKLMAVRKSLAKVEGEDPGFSPYHNLLERHLYRTGGPLGDPRGGEGDDEP